jgi:acetoin utilization deacetylase AcuC-like enzyme
MKHDLLVFHDARADWHDTGPAHPERIGRLAPIIEVVDRMAINRIELRESPEFADKWDHTDRLLDAVCSCHTPSYLERLQDACRTGAPYIDSPDSAIDPRSWDAALATVGCALAAVDAVASDFSSRAFVPMRPPGHHAEADRSLGFCLINNVAVAADWLISHVGVARVAIIDFDVHHGNGTQHIFNERDDVLYISSHQHPATIFPGTGHENERGTQGTPGEGFTLNIPLMPHSDGDEALRRYEKIVIPRLDAFQPEFIIISAGFDADRRDAIAQLNWNASTFERITEYIAEVADAHADGRIVSILKGGYHLQALAEGVETHLNVLVQS